MLTQFLSNHCILCLVLNAGNQEKSTVVCLASFLSVNGHISAHDVITNELNCGKISKC